MCWGLSWVPWFRKTTMSAFVGLPIRTVSGCDQFSTQALEVYGVGLCGRGNPHPLITKSRQRFFISCVGIVTDYWERAMMCLRGVFIISRA